MGLAVVLVVDDDVVVASVVLVVEEVVVLASAAPSAEGCVHADAARLTASRAVAAEKRVVRAWRLMASFGYGQLGKCRRI
jgi:hypothetical protein